ncbi:hypothetical protein Cgig2_008875 [Carnegiea gigantea]|uniref:3-beta hydroxysteroid dehydrogenase/isomerase domain-containing protein n=1 Tax=Carnegiea gigantea TaxID=171969 RepID=A0A9Q1GYR6_9CARY|nr:hypothetical protein Cgig2_008875 [Carnegiea gigantea]
MHLSENEGIEGKTFVVTGGYGFLGAALALELIRRGAALVRSIDIRSSSPWSTQLQNAGVVSILGDITCKKDVEKALRGADCVFHVASYGMSGKQMLQVGRIHNVNINGTCLILDSCVKLGVKRLVYVSTSNVVFGGQEIRNGDETLPYWPLDDHVEHYSRSKSIAEQLVLKYNGRPLRETNGECLYTCAIRPPAIYGPGENRHIPRVLKATQLGLLLFKVGDPTIKTDWLYVDNLVLALVLASMGLLDDNPARKGKPMAAGQAYFISDGHPVNTCQFLSPLLKSLDYDMPKITLPLPFALVFAKICWVLYTILYPWLDKPWLPQPIFLPAEIYKLGVTHYFSFQKAKLELGYVPVVSPKEGMAATISYWRERKRQSLDGPTIFTWLFCVIGMTSLFAVAFLPVFGPLSLLKAFALLLFRSEQGIQIVFYMAAAAHLIEATYAWHLARKVNPANSKGWFWQTFALGFFSLRFLLKRARTQVG